MLSVALACAVTACNGPRANDREDAGPHLVTTPTTSTTLDLPAQPPAEARSMEGDVLAAVEGFLRTTISVNDPPDPDHQDLALYRTGAVLEHAVTAVTQNRLLGLAYRLPAASSYSHVATVQSLTDERAVVRICVVDDALQIALADGRVLNAAVATKLFETGLRRIDGRWKVAENALLDRWEGVTGCVASQGS